MCFYESLALLCADSWRVSQCHLQDPAVDQILIGDTMYKRPNCSRYRDIVASLFT